MTPRNKNEKIAVVVAHTHWDREWYLPFQMFRHGLVRMVDGLLDLLEANPDFKCFVLDGQTIAVEDYLEIRPDREAGFRELAKEKRILIGPWHVLPDEFLVSGESLIRNLELGHGVAARFGGAMKVGYVPDPFGHVGQLPQILRGFGIGSAVFTRGAGAHPALEKTAFRWKSPSGHEVLAIHQLVGGYGGFADLPADPGELAARTRNLLERMERRSPFPIFLLGNGNDHLPPEPDLPEKIRGLNERLPDFKFEQGDFSDFLKLAASENATLGEYTGELRGGRYHSLLPGVLSARMHIKQENAATQTALSGLAEPLAATAALLAGAPWPAGELDAAWRLLLQNHPHDSICGCSVDGVHREMMPRFHQARQIAENIVADAAAAIAGVVSTSGGSSGDCGLKIIAFNTTGRERTDVCACRVPLNGDTASLLDGNWAAECGGAAFPVSVEKSGPENIFGKTAYHKKETLEIRFIAENVPAFGWKLFYLKKQNGTPAKRELSLSGRTLENEYLKVRVEDGGSLSLTHKETGVEYGGINFFEDDGDCGDEYDFSPAGKTLTTKRAKAKIEKLIQNATSVGLRIEIPLKLPEELSDDDNSRSKKKVPCPLSVSVFLHAGVPRLDVRVEFENNARDHRLRAVFPTPFNVESAVADSAFEHVSRPLRPPKGEDWHQKPGNTHPMQSFFDISDGKAGLAILARGLPEYEARKTRNGTTGYLTLLRCVGVLSRKSLPARPEQAGPDLPTPEAQCPGSHRFEYSIYPRGHDPAHIQAAAFNCPLLGVPAGKFHDGDAIVADAEATGGLIIKEVEKSADRTADAPLPESGSPLCGSPLCGSLVKIEPAEVVPAALRLRESGKLELRFFNASKEKSETKIETFLPVESVEKVNLLGEREGEQPEIAGSNLMTLKVAPSEILTLHVKFKKA